MRQSSSTVFAGSATPSAGRGIAIAASSLLLLASVFAALLVPFAALLVPPAALLVPPAADAANAACANEELRAGSSTNLPDCRVYEMVSPPDKNGYYVTSGESATGDNWGQASATGDAVAYTANGALPGSATNAVSNFYLASRGEGGWSTQPLLPSQAFSYSLNIVEPVFAAFSRGLSSGILSDATDSPPLVSGEQEPTAQRSGNLFVRDNATGAYSLVNAVAPGLHPPPYAPIFDGASADFATVIFDARAPLTSEAPGGGVDNLYESAGSMVNLISQIPPAGKSSCGPAGPACAPAPHGGEFGAGNAVETNQSRAATLLHVISSDGSRVFFTAEGDLYVRENAATTIQVDAPHGPGPGGGGAWATAAGDGSKVFFYDGASAGLTADTVPGSGENLYSYDTIAETLADLTSAAQAGVQAVIGASEDGSYLYFVATGVLTTERNSLEQEAQAGQPNLYLSHAGTTSFIATVANPDVAGRQKLTLFYDDATRLTPDGRHLAFFAKGERTSQIEKLNGELFEYSADSGRLQKLCACAGSYFYQPLVSSVSLHQIEDVYQFSRGLSGDGSRVFFDSEDALLPRDTNGVRDVYEYELDGAGSCQVASGCLYLISSGTSAKPSGFVDASASGNDVFFTTAQQLARPDSDGATDLYDARVEGGFPSPPSPAPCLGDACQPVPPSVNDPTPSSFSFAGAGNLPPAPGRHVAKPRTRAPRCGKGREPRRGRCVRVKRARRATARSSGRGQR